MDISPIPIDPDSPRIFIDSSVLIAGSASPRGASHAILVLAELGLLQLVICPYIFDEAERNISAKLPKGLPRFQQLKTALSFEIQPDPPHNEVSRWLAIVPAKDAPVLAAAVLAQPSRFVTLDVEHFVRSPQVAAASGLIICTPGDLLREIRLNLARGFGNRP